MATGQDIAEFYARLKISVDPSDIRKMDIALGLIESKMQAFAKKMQAVGLNITKFSIDDKQLQKTLGNALDAASTKVKFEVSQFVVNERNLQAALLRAGRNFRGMPGLAADGGVDTIPAQRKPRAPSPEQMRRTELRNAEWDRQEAWRKSLADRRFTLQSQKLDLQAERLNERMKSPTTKSVASGMGAGVAMSRMFAPIAALAIGGYGLNFANERNQALVAATLQSSAVVQQAGGTPEQGKESFEWLRQQGNKIGFNYLEAAPEYNNLLANMTGAGFSVKQGQDVFKSFAELSRTYKLGKVQQQRVNLALSQIAGKGQLQSQELKLQLGQALPGAEGMFAQAYQNMTGGKLTGQQSIAALLEAMKKGKVSSDILNYVAPLAHDKAVKGGLDVAETASVAESNRLQNQINDLMRIASDSGLESGFARIFKTLRESLEESGPLAESVGKAFDEISKKFRIIALVPQSFQRMLEGKDSYVGSVLGVQNTEEFKKSIESIKESLHTIGTVMPDTLISIDSTIKDIATIVKAIAVGLGFVKKVADTTVTSGGIADRVQQSMIESGQSPTGFTAGLRGAGMFAYSMFLNDEDRKAAEEQVKRQYTLASDFTPLNMYKYPGHVGDNDIDFKGFVDPVAAMGAFGFSADMFNQAQKSTQMQEFHVNIASVVIESTAENVADFSIDISSAFEKVFKDALSDTNNNHPRFGK